MNTAAKTTTTRPVGRPKHNPQDAAKVVLMVQYFCLSNRAAQGYMLLFKEKLCLTSLFSYKTIERAYDDVVVRDILDEVFELTHMPVKDLEHWFDPDATGLSTSSKKNYEVDRAKNQTSGKGYRKILVMVGLRYKFISSFRFAVSSVDHESPYFESLLEQTARRYSRVDVVSADSVYTSRYNCELVVGVGGVPRFYPKRGCRLRQRGSRAWRDMLEALVVDPQRWLSEYHKRSNVRVVFQL